MKPIAFKRSRFRLKRFLDALHQFSVQNLSSGNPLPVVVGDTAHHDPVDLADEGEEEIEIPDDSLARLQAGLSLYATFASFNGFDGFDTADGQYVEVPCLDDDDCDEPMIPRRRRTKKYLEAVENSVADECSSFGFCISLAADKVEIEAMGMSDVSGECELGPMVEPNLLSDAMRRWVKSFLIPIRGEKR